MLSTPAAGHEDVTGGLDDEVPINLVGELAIGMEVVDDVRLNVCISGGVLLISVSVGPVPWTARQACPSGRTGAGRDGGLLLLT